MLTVICFFLRILSVLALEKVTLSILCSLWLISFSVSIILASKRQHTTVKAALLFFLGATWAVSHIMWQQHLALPQSILFHPVTITAEVSDIPVVHKDYQSVLIHVHTIGTNPQTHFTFARLIQLNSSVNKTSVFLPKPGQVWQLTVVLKPPHGLKNPGTYDAEVQDLAKGLVGTATLSNKITPVLLQDIRWHQAIARLRLNIATTLQQHIPLSAGLALLLAILLGDRSQITRDQTLIFQQTGTSHLLVIAGLHIGLITFLGVMLGNLLWRTSRKVMILLPTPIAATLFGFSLAVIYALLAGGSLPTVRALIMLAVVLGGKILRRPTALWQGYARALLIILIVWPLAPLTASFWLSFYCVGLLLWIINQFEYQTNENNLATSNQEATSKPHKLHRLIHHFKLLLRLQYQLLLGLIPLNLFWFQQIAWVSMLANLMAIFLFEWLVLPGMLLGLLLLGLNTTIAIFCFNLICHVLNVLQYCLHSLTLLPFATSTKSLPSALVTTLVCVGILLLLTPRRYPFKWVALFLLLPLFFTKPLLPKLNHGAVRITVLDVGEGLAVFVETKHHRLLYDTGGRFGDDNDAGQFVLAPFIKLQQLSHLDKLIVSHTDLDHWGGVNSILQQFKIDALLTSNPIFLQQQTKAPFTACSAGQSWQWDDVDFKILWPEAGAAYKGNESSCVLQIKTRTNSILLPGDIERESEAALVNNFRTELKSDILIAPHHGSRTSSTLLFLKMVAPKWVVISAGFMNRYRFPNQSVINRYQTLGTKMLNVSATGAVMITLDSTAKESIQVTRK